jgi:heat shock protein HslJ
MCQSQSINGSWSVDSFTTKTTTLDGKSLLKGPTVVKDVNIAVTIDGRRYIERSEGKTTTYRMVKTGPSYRLSRTEAGRRIEIALSQVQLTADTLRFVSTRVNRQRKERTVVSWSMVRAANDSVQDIEWSLVEIAYNDDTILKPYRGEKLSFVISRGRITGTAGVNKFSGIAKLGADRSIKMGPLLSTRAADPEGSIAQRFLRDLEQVKKFLFDKGDLILELPIDAGIIRLRPASTR